MNSTLFNLSSHCLLASPNTILHILVCHHLCPSPRPVHCALWNPEHGISRISSMSSSTLTSSFGSETLFAYWFFSILGGWLLFLLFVPHMHRVWRGVFLTFHDDFHNELWALYSSVSNFSGSPAGRTDHLPPPDTLVCRLLRWCAPSWNGYCLDVAFPFIDVPINILEYIGIHRHSHVAEYLLNSSNPLHLIFCPSTPPQLLIFILIL